MLVRVTIMLVVLLALATHPIVFIMLAIARVSSWVRAMPHVPNLRGGTAAAPVAKR